MGISTRLLVPAFLLGSILAFGQATDTPFQITYIPNLNNGDSVINLTNSGASSTVAFPTQNGKLCANVYVLAPDSSLQACCSCLLPANGLKSFSVQADLINNTVTKPAPTSVTVKLMGTIAGAGDTCDPRTVGTGTNFLATGMLAWATKLHTAPVNTGFVIYSLPGSAVTEVPFTATTLSAAELVSLNNQCTAIGVTPGTAGVCRACAQAGR